MKQAGTGQILLPDTIYVAKTNNHQHFREQKELILTIEYQGYSFLITGCQSKGRLLAFRH